MTRTFAVEPWGEKFATVCRTDGFWVATWWSKNKKSARRKGEDFVAGRRTSMYTYTTATGRAANEANSNQPRKVGAMTW